VITNTTDKTVLKLEKQLVELKKKLAAARKKGGRRQVQDYELHGWGGGVRLSELFGDKKELIVVQNMGKQCPYCTLWADGFNGMLNHLEDRAAFVVCSPDSTEEQQLFANSRGWKFRMVSSQGTAFKRDLAFERKGKDNRPLPGVSTFEKDAKGRVWHVASAGFGPGDDYCSLWSLLDLLPKSTWAPKFSYAPTAKERSLAAAR
jgi:predicted dithiol-disulfide oxidoreductase (DUF899 family)